MHLFFSAITSNAYLGLIGQTVQGLMWRGAASLQTAENRFFASQSEIAGRRLLLRRSVVSFRGFPAWKFVRVSSRCWLKHSFARGDRCGMCADEVATIFDHASITSVSRERSR